MTLGKSAADFNSLSREAIESALTVAQEGAVDEGVLMINATILTGITHVVLLLEEISTKLDSRTGPVV